MGYVPKPPPKPGSGIYTDRNGSTAHREKISGKEKAIGIISGVLFVILLVLLLESAFGFGMIPAAGDDQVFFHVVCHDDGRKIYDEILLEERGFDYHFSNSRSRRVDLPLDKCILEEVDRPSFWAGDGR